MFNHSIYNPQPGQGTQVPRPPPHLQHLQAPPPLPHNFQHGPLLPPSQVPPRPGQPGLHIYQHGPLGPRGLPNSGQPYLHPPPTIAPLPRMYTTAQQNQQHSSYLAPGLAPLPPRNLLPTPSSGYKASTHQLPQQPSGVQGVQQIPPPPPHPPTSSFSTSAQSASVSQATLGNSQLPSMAPPPAYSTAPPIPPSSPPPVSSPVLKSIPLPPPKPAEEKIVQKIEELCQHIAKNGSSYEDMVCQKESGNPEFKFLFGGKPGSEDAIAYEYFLWMKKQCLLTNKLDGTDPAVPTKHLMVANECHSPANSDMDMEMEG